MIEVSDDGRMTRVVVIEACPAVAACPVCGQISWKHSRARARRLRGLARDYELRSCKYYCADCGRHFTLRTDVNRRGARDFADEVVEEALRMLAKGTTYQKVTRRLSERYGLRVPPATVHDWHGKHRMEARRRLEES